MEAAALQGHTRGEVYPEGIGASIPRGRQRGLQIGNGIDNLHGWSVSAGLSSNETVIEINAYKSRLAIIVPPEYRVELEGTAFKGSMENLTTGGLPGSPHLLVHGSAYKSTVIVTSRDPEALLS